MKFFTLDTVFQFSWGQVVTAFWQRYPNPNSKHVLSEDVIERWLCGDKLFTKRLIQKKGSIPKWGERIITGCSHAYVVEESMLDLASHTLTTYTRNINLKEISI
ncbi:PREL-like protein [Mya arenaria]|uniref:PREL-like protein n=1 Tax=Mya arenaria TaxID=6604 RepID=A0ABY7FFA8_MYAAR|nr:PREL-like protein [Mya arenaria]